MIHLWDARTWNEKERLHGHSKLIFDVAFTSDSQRLASTSMDGMIKIWSPDTPQVLLTLRGSAEISTSLTFSLDGFHLLSAGNNRVITIWDAAPAEPRRREAP
jgi:WD40 repeat protein